MQYKMQFTVLDDAVKQNRKLPEIAFFDTDGNLIHLGAGGGGGDVDVSALLPLDGSKAMTDMLGFSDGTADPDVFLERQYSGELVLAGVPLVDQYSYGERPDAFYGGQAEFLIATDHGDGAWNGPTIDMWVGYYSYGNGPIANMVIDGINRQIDMGGGKVHVHRKTAYHQAINHAFAVFDEGSGSGAYNPTWSVGDDGVMYWGDGTLVAPDVSLERTQWGGLLATTPDGLAVAAVDPDPAYNTAAVYLDHAGKITVQPAQPNDTAFLIGPAAVGDGVYRFQMDGHGQMWWSDGVNPEDVSLKRAYAGALGVGEAVYLDGLSGQVGVYPASDLTQPIFAGGLNGGSDRYQVLADGSIHWGDGTAAPDTHLSRSGAGALELYGGLSAIGHDIGATANSDWDVSYAAVMNTGEFQVVRTENDRIFRAGLTTDGDWAFSINARGTFEWGDGTATPDVKLQRAAAGVLEIPQHGGGFKLTSPDGSQTKTVRLSNAGALELV